MKGATVTSIAEIAEFLEHEGELVGDGWRAWVKRAGSVSISGVRTNDDAQLNDLAWLSTWSVDSIGEELARFKGSLLLVPADAADSEVPNGVLPCRRPKLALIKVVDAHLRHLTITEWPTLGGPAIHPKTSMGSGANLCEGVVVGSGVEIGDRVFVGPNTVLANCTIASDVRIGANSSIGLDGFGYAQDESGNWHRFPHIGRVLIANGVEIGSNTCIDRGALGDTRIGAGAKIDNLVHIAHNVTLGASCLVTAQATLCGSARVGERCWVSPASCVLNKITVGPEALIGIGAMVISDVEAGTVVSGNPARRLGFRYPERDESPS